MGVLKVWGRREDFSAVREEVTAEEEVVEQKF